MSKMIAQIKLTMEINAKLHVVIHIFFVINAKEMEYALNVKMNSILEKIVLIYVINAQMVSAILMASVMIKLQIVNIIIIMGLNAITSVIQNVINVIEMELA